MSKEKQVPEGYRKISVNVKKQLFDGVRLIARKEIITFSRAVERALKIYIEESKDGE